MFGSLSEKITETFKKLKGQGRISESSLNNALREIRIALLEADVALTTTKDFVENIKNKALGQEVLSSVTPDQMVVKIVNDELIRVLGSESYEINLKSKPPVIILMAGLQGSGKTTSSAKLAKRISDLSMVGVSRGINPYFSYTFEIFFFILSRAIWSFGINSKNPDNALIFFILSFLNNILYTYIITNPLCFSRLR